MDGDFFTGIDCTDDLGSDSATDREFGERGDSVFWVDGVDLLLFSLGNSKGFNGTVGSEAILKNNLFNYMHLATGVHSNFTLWVIFG